MPQVIVSIKPALQIGKPHCRNFWHTKLESKTIYSKSCYLVTLQIESRTETDCQVFLLDRYLKPDILLFMSGKQLIAQHNYLCILLDYYGNLLTQRRQQILNMSLEDDMSLSEIAEKLNISRQAVHNNIQQAVEQLKQYEYNLGMVHKDQSLINKVDYILNNYEFEQKPEIVFELEELKAMIL